MLTLHRDRTARGATLQELFPLKMRDQAINQSFAFLKSKKLMPEEDEVSATAMRCDVLHCFAHDPAHDPPTRARAHARRHQNITCAHTTPPPHSHVSPQCLHCFRAPTHDTQDDYDMGAMYEDAGVEW